MKITGLPALSIVAFYAMVLAACTVGPEYVKPTVAIPLSYKEAAGWKQAQPADTSLTTTWWKLFNDPQLSRLEEQVVISNQNIALAEAQFRQARALVEGSKAALYPSLTIGASATRSQGSGNLGRTQAGVQSDYLLPASLSWEIDVWGRIRRSIEASQAGLQASAADLAAARLSVQAELAGGLFSAARPGCPETVSG